MSTQEDRDDDLRAQDNEDRLQRTRAASLRGTWERPGEYLDSAHEAEAVAEEDRIAAAVAEEGRLNAIADEEEAKFLASLDWDVE